ncbi:MAG: TIGR00282 family metallophosphoesterase [Deltaproteobacteria bacterium]|nr:TIGR00282 family metallophosphoesterase [Deltaproteobacteria bacterium]
MRVLFLGDVVASAGKAVIQAFVPEMRKSENLTFVIANGENVAGGLGIDEKSAVDLFQSGVDLITGGNHSWDKREIAEFMARDRRVLRPANFPDDPQFPVPGKGHAVLEGPNCRLGVLNLMGRVHMDPLDDPFAVGSRWVDWFDSHDINCILVDFHAEASSEKQAFAHYVAGRVSAVVGSHTHVQTADERLLLGPSGAKTAYITDAGMTGPYDSVIGMKKEKSIQRFLSKMPQRYEPAEGMPGLHGVIIDIDDRNGEATAIRRISRFL